MQKIVKEFLDNHNLYCGETIRYIDLSSEIGELGKEIIKSTIAALEGKEVKKIEGS